jgi:Tol biopolymer transport system component
VVDKLRPSAVHLATIGPTETSGPTTTIETTTTTLLAPLTVPTTTAVAVAPTTRPSTTTTRPQPIVTIPPLPFGTVSAINGPGLYVVNVDGTGLRRLVSANNASSPSWSPDGRTLAYMHGGIDIVTLDGHQQTLAPQAATVQRPAWSPDGSHIAYPGPSSVPGERDPWVVATDGKSSAQELAMPGDDAQVDWGSNNRLVTMGGFGLATANPDGTNRQVIYSQPLNYGVLHWSPDSGTIAALPSQEATDLLISPDGTNPRQLGHGNPVSAGAEFNYDEAEWAPNSRQLAYSENARRTGHMLIEVAAADGSAGTVIAQDMEWPSWSPRGDLIVALGNPNASGQYRDIKVMGPDGAGARSIGHLDVAGQLLGSSVFSPDGRTVAFTVSAL